MTVATARTDWRHRRRKPLAMALCLCLSLAFSLFAWARNEPNREDSTEDTHMYAQTGDAREAPLERLTDAVGNDDATTFSTVQDATKLFYCQMCGRAITGAAQLFDFPSDKTSESFNETWFGDTHRLTQVFVNPAGDEFELLTARTASHLVGGNFVADSTWWPGYSWAPAVCPACHSHIGWVYQRAPQSPVLPPGHPFHSQYPARFVGLSIAALEFHVSLLSANAEDEEEL